MKDKYYNGDYYLFNRIGPRTIKLNKLFGAQASNWLFNCSVAQNKQERKFGN